MADTFPAGADTSRLAIVGSTALVDDPRVVELVNNLLDTHDPVTVISGGAVGVDTTAAAIARARGIGCVEHFPGTRNWTGYAARNRLIADDCTALVRIASAKSKTYGSGWTRDRAAELGKPTLEFVL